eukprot:TRINITY_DN790_c0_g2_i1.p1 TRINITY_DN790_c0_g2~~TRINITY_DN790_c0_g2_i1.p1  ORF type:complete len:424 (-),score=87.22 TRINITY_DN790_c0_g2_i1:463-1656(-)
MGFSHKILLCFCFVLFIVSISFLAHIKRLYIVEEAEWAYEEEAFNKEIEIINRNKKGLVNEIHDLQILLNDTLKAADILPVYRETDISENLLNYQYGPNHSIGTLIGGSRNQYWIPAITQFYSIKHLQTRVPNYQVMVRKCDTLLPVVRDYWERNGAVINCIDDIEVPKDGHFHIAIDAWEGAFNKLLVWNQTQFDKFLFLDADVIPVNNLDHLLNEPELTAPWNFCHCVTDDQIEYLKNNDPYHLTINSGFFVGDPSLDTLNYMMNLTRYPSPDPDDLNEHGGTWWWGDQEMFRVMYQNPDTRIKKWNILDGKVYDVIGRVCESTGCQRDLAKKIQRSFHLACIYKLWEYGMSIVQMETPSCFHPIVFHWHRLLNRVVRDIVIDFDKLGKEVLLSY